jgi:uncharacterized protein YvpB
MPVRIFLLLALGLLAGCSSSPAPSSEFARDRAVWSTEFDHFRDFDLSFGGTNGAVSLTSPVIRSPMPWDELVVSWNVRSGPGAIVRVDASAITTNGEPTGFYRLADWTLDNLAEPRRSPLQEGDAVGRVDVDTLRLNRPASAVQIRFTIEKTLPVEANLVHLGLAFRNTRAPFSSSTRPSLVAPLDVPELSQADYPEQRGWCSPASVAMVLGFWAEKLHRPELAKDVPEVARGVFDRNYNGTGNWSFNVAYAGSFPGLRATVARFETLEDVRGWVARGVPVIISGPFSLLADNPKASSAGHVVVVVGFTKEGDVIFNDPWAVRSRGQAVRRVYDRKNVEAAWARSGHTVYLIRPDQWPE